MRERFKEGNSIMMDILMYARRHYAECIKTEYMRGFFDGQMVSILAFVGVEPFVYQGVANEIRYLQRRAAERNGSKP